jgi:hypothetical protein
MAREWQAAARVGMGLSSWVFFIVMFVSGVVTARFVFSRER